MLDYFSDSKSPQGVSINTLLLNTLGRLNIDTLNVVVFRIAANGISIHEPSLIRLGKFPR